MSIDWSKLDNLEPLPSVVFIGIILLGAGIGIVGGQIMGEVASLSLGIATMMAGFTLLNIQNNLVNTKENSVRMKNIENTLKEMREQLDRIEQLNKS